jgi:hypothetical protein
MTLTWRQVDAYRELNERLDRMERANDLAIAAIGAQGDGKTIEKTIKELGTP